MNRFMLLIFAVLFCALPALAQNEAVDMADTWRREGKIWVVIAVILTIFAGLIFYLIRLDRKMSRLEKSST